MATRARVERSDLAAVESKRHPMFSGRLVRDDTSHHPDVVAGIEGLHDLTFEPHERGREAREPGRGLGASGIVQQDAHVKSMRCRLSR